MEALRLVKKPENGVITIRLPGSFKSHNLIEVILKPVEEVPTERKSTFDPRKFRGIWKNWEIDVDSVSREMRQAWERDF